MLKLMVADDEMIERKVLEKMIRQGCKSSAARKTELKC